MLEDASPPLGQRFSLVYGDRGTPTQDSKRMRRRLAELVAKQNLGDLGNRVQSELGVDMIWGFESANWRAFLERWPCHASHLLTEIPGPRLLDASTKGGCERDGRLLKRGV